MTELTEAEIDALCAATGYLRTDARRMEWVTKAVERIIDARLAPIRALADEWEAYSAADEWHAADCWNAAPGILRAVLAGATDEEDE
jgi:hypothetical protein